MQVILASASPRRLALLQQIGIEATVCPADFDEVSGSAVQAEDVVLANAVGKCQAVVKIKGDSLPVIAADTVVVAEGVILGKPQNAEDAVDYAGEMLAEVCETKVVFRDLTDEEIKNYVATGEPLDKAGAYGIQGKGAVLVEKIDGCYNNVVGLPLTRTQLILAKLGVC